MNKLTPENLAYEKQRQKVASWLELAYKITEILDNHHITPNDFESALPFILGAKFQQQEPNDPIIHQYFDFLYKQSVSCLKLGKLANKEKSNAN